MIPTWTVLRREGLLLITRAGENTGSAPQPTLLVTWLFHRLLELTFHSVHLRAMVELKLFKAKALSVPLSL